ncbi:MAG TPA: 50S ribosomal protein L11 methyltransferase [Myxococcaceae bacterium]|nr:50S ribosomal protein L11 methyltransferase [Myxococcaceae bacterium]
MSAPASYFALSAELPESSSELAQWLLHKNESLGLEIRDRSVRAMPGEPPVTGGRVRVVAFFGERHKAERAREELRRRVPDVTLSLSEALCEDWSESWKSQVRSAQVGRLWIGPPWRTADAAPGSIRIMIEPKMAFGTGDHPTTQLCLEALDGLLTGRSGQSVLDVGTGSGVLAIAAKKLGAGRVRGVDTDPRAIELAKENFQLNQVDGIELSDEPVASIVEPFDILIANLFANALVQLAPVFRRLARKYLVVCGILDEQVAEVEAAYRQQRFALDGRQARGEWVRLELTPR